MWLKAPNIKCNHAFSTRWGGVSSQPYNELNLGGSDDLPENISTNRNLFLKSLGFDTSKLCYLKQTHSNVVNEASIGQTEGDALISNQKGLVLAVSIADCFPLLLHDEKNGVIAAVHAGWRGTVAGIVQNAVLKMLGMGAEHKNIQVAIGQGICKENFIVGDEVIEQFKSAGFPEKYLSDNKIDLAACNRYLLEKNGVPQGNIWSMNRCTYENDFFSYRRDKGITGRMWAVIGM